MVMLSADTTDISHRCDNCGMDASTAFTALEAGTSEVPGVPIFSDKNTIRMPSCAGCGAVTTLNRRFEDAIDYPGQLFPDKVKARWELINAIHKKLIDDGQVNDDCAAAIAAETIPPKLVATLPFTSQEG